MSRYGYSRYSLTGSSLTSTYGEATRLSNSVLPMSAEALGYTATRIYWAPTTGDFNTYRLVRNQDGFPETQEDGIIVWTASSTSSDSSFDDKDNVVQLVPGKFVYYRMWLKTPSGIWVAAGDTFTILPKQHGILAPDGTSLYTTHQRLMDQLPKAYTSSVGSPSDVVDETSDLFKFLSAFSLTFDEAMTYADLLRPEFLGRSSEPTLMELQARQLGVIFEPSLSSKIQKRLIRDAIYTYGIKGTKKSVEVFSEDLTGFAPTVTISPNLFLDIQNSSFAGGSIGNWLPIGCTLTATNTIIPPTTGDTGFSPTNAATLVDSSEVATVVVTNTGSYISNGADSPVLKSIPVSYGTSYNFTYFAKSLATGSITPSVTWYDINGTSISTSTGSATSTGTSWAKQTFNAYAPGRFSAISSISATSGVVTATLPTGHPFTTSSSVVTSELPTLNTVALSGAFTVSSYTSTSISFAVTGISDFSSTSVTGIASTTETKAEYASVKLVFNTAGTYYLDMFQLADSNDSRSSAFNEARQVTVFLSPNKTNFMLNPSFELYDSGTHIPTGWTVTGTPANVNTTLYDAYSGTKMLEVTTSGTSNVNILSRTISGTFDVGAFYTFSLYMNILSGSPSLSLNISVTDGTNTVSTSTPLTVVLGTGSGVTEAGWKRYQTSVYVPYTFGTSLTFTTSLYGFNGTGLIHLDSAQLEETTTATDYFDGSLPSVTGALWGGTAHLSNSYMYYGVTTKTQRLVSQLPSVLPYNTPFVVSTYNGVAGSGIA